MKNKKGGHSVTGGLKMGVNVAAHTRHIFLESAPPPQCSPLSQAAKPACQHSVSHHPDEQTG